MAKNKAEAIARFPSPVGLLEVAAENDRLTRVTKVPSNRKKVAPSTPVLRQAKKQLDQYFAGRLKSFSLPLAPPLGDFDRQVWEGLQKVPFGQSVAYSDLAEKVGNPKGARAVGGACGRNPHMIVVPCHRVLAKNRRIGGFSGGAGVKETLLQHEGIEHF